MKNTRSRGQPFRIARNSAEREANSKWLQRQYQIIHDHYISSSSTNYDNDPSHYSLVLPQPEIPRCVMLHYIPTYLNSGSIAPPGSKIVRRRTIPLTAVLDLSPHIDHEDINSNYRLGDTDIFQETMISYRGRTYRTIIPIYSSSSYTIDHFDWRFGY